ncbi:MAG TPA: sodium ion-translocating decarboxylase subunit beta [Polyangiaceae bacterium]
MKDNWLELFGGLATLVDAYSANPAVFWARIGMILLAFLLVYLGKKGTLEPLLMIPMGLGMAAVNAGVLFLDPVTAGFVNNGAPVAVGARMHGTLFVAPLVSETNSLMNIMQIDFLQPIYTMMFSNGLIACLVFMGIGVLLDVGFVLARPYSSMFLAITGELGTVATFPIAIALGLAPGEAAAISMVGGADGPMVLFTSLMLAKDMFVPITVVAYLYLGLTYGGYPYLIKFLVPKELLALPCKPVKTLRITAGEKLAFAVLACTVMCLLFPVAAPLFLSLFLGVAVREAGLTYFTSLVENVLLYGSTMFLGLLLGILCEAGTILDPKIFKLLVLGILALLLSGIGGIIGGYIMYFATGRKYNPAVGIAAVSCVPTTAKVAQKCVSAANPSVIVLPEALGANICGVITSAVLTGVYVTLLR